MIMMMMMVVVVMVMMVVVVMVMMVVVVVVIRVVVTRRHVAIWRCWETLGGSDGTPKQGEGVMMIMMMVGCVMVVLVVMILVVMMMAIIILTVDPRVLDVAGNNGESVPHGVEQAHKVVERRIHDLPAQDESQTSSHRHLCLGHLYMLSLSVSLPFFLSLSPPLSVSVSL
jgi:hypothetical protein